MFQNGKEKTKRRCKNRLRCSCYLLSVREQENVKSIWLIPLRIDVLSHRHHIFDDKSAISKMCVAHAQTQSERKSGARSHTSFLWAKKSRANQESEGNEMNKNKAATIEATAQWRKCAGVWRWHQISKKRHTWKYWRAADSVDEHLAKKPIKWKIATDIRSDLTRSNTHTLRAPRSSRPNATSVYCKYANLLLNYWFVELVWISTCTVEHTVTIVWWRRDAHKKPRLRNEEIVKSR